MFWIDGTLHERPRVVFDLRDRGLSLGDGIFESVAVYNGAAFRLEAHLQRLVEAGATLRLPVDTSRVREGVQALLGATQAPLAAMLRIAVSRGVGARGLALPESVTARVWLQLAPRGAPLRRPVALCRSTIRRNEASPLANLKTLSYLEQVLVYQQAVEAGFDDALMLNTCEAVACTSAANVFAILGDHLVTPPIADGVRAGTMRELILTEAPAIGLSTAQRTLDWPSLLAADAAFITSSGVLVRGVSRIGNHYWDQHAAVAELRRAIERRIATECNAQPRRR